MKPNTLLGTLPSGIERLRERLRSVPEHQYADNTNRVFVFKVVLSGTVIICSVLSALLCVSYAVLGNYFVGTRLLVSFGLLAYLGGIALLIYRFNLYRAAAPLFVLFYAVLAFGCAWQWGINSVFAILLFSLVITLAGVIIRARAALLMALGATLALSFIQIAVAYGHQPVGSAAERTSNFGQILGYSIVFFIIALTSWLYSNQMERSLRKAERAEFLLERQKANLEILVQQRTAALEAKQLEELEQLNRFAQVGTLSTGLLHDLVNYLTVLTLDLENLHTQHKSRTLDHASQTIHYIEDMIDGVRQQLQGKAGRTSVDVSAAITLITTILQRKAEHANVALSCEVPDVKKPLFIAGDPTRFTQVLSIFLTNAIEASAQRTEPAPVHLAAYAQRQQLVITIKDYGNGIGPQRRSQLFTAFKSSKKEGMGIGLYLAKQIIETHFGGSVVLASSKNPTEFLLTFPLKANK